MKTRLKEDMKSAMKSGDKTRLGVIRMVISAIRNKEIELGKELDDAGAQDVISKAVKQRRESVEQYRNASRPDLADKEEAEISALKGYLPEQMDEEKIRQTVTQAIEESGASSAGDMGKVMKHVMPKLKGKADGALVNRIVKETLGS